VVKQPESIARAILVVVNTHEVRMHIGVIYPQTEYGSDPGAIRAFAQTVEALGYHIVVTYEHVLGADPARPGGLHGPYTYAHEFQEPFVMFAYMAAATRTLRFGTRILVLPQRQTALVAKQAATLDVLSGGRFARLGVGNGWNEPEFEALGQDFHVRGRRMEEQIALLRRLWSEPLVTFDGRWDRVPGAGVAPRPARPIPIWIGGHAPEVLARTARLADGWMPNQATAEQARPQFEELWRLLAAHGRPRADFGVEVRLPYGDGQPDAWRATLTGWQAAGATDAVLNTMGFGFAGPDAHLAVLRRFAEALELKPA
jgi:probable F420-dependent oxidoreductase